MSDAQIKSVALFFFFAFFDERVAIELTSKAIRLVRKRSRDEAMDTNSIIIQIAQNIFVKEAKRREVGPLPQDLSAFQIPDAAQLGHLHQLRKSVTPEEFSCLVWTKVLGLSDAIVAAGLASSIGTVRHRTAHALKALAQVVPPPGDAHA